MSFTQFVRKTKDFVHDLQYVGYKSRYGPWGDKRLEDKLQKILFGCAAAADWNGEDQHYHDNDSDLYVVYSEDENYIIDRIHVKTSREKMKAIDAAIARVNRAERSGYQRGTTVFKIPGEDGYEEKLDAQIREYDNTREHHGHNAPKPEDNVPHYKEKKFKTVF